MSEYCPERRCAACLLLCVQVPITDVYGPTAWDRDLQCLVVTMDTARGGEKVNAEREKRVREDLQKPKTVPTTLHIRVSR